MLNIPKNTQADIRKWLLEAQLGWAYEGTPLTVDMMARLNYWISSTDSDGHFKNSGHRAEFYSRLGFAWQHWVIPEIERMFDEGITLPNSPSCILLTGTNGKMRLSFNQEYDKPQDTHSPFFLVTFNHKQIAIELNLYGFFPGYTQKNTYSISDLWSDNR